MEPVNQDVYRAFHSYISPQEVDEVLKPLEAEFIKAQYTKTCPMIDWFTWSKNTLKKVRKLDSKISFKSFNFSDIDSLHRVQGILLGRLAKFCEDVQGMDDIYVATKYTEEILNFSKKSAEEKQYFIPLLLNSSRGLLDTKKTAKNSLKFLENCAVYCTLSLEEEELFNSSLNYFRKTLETNLVKWALEQFLKTNKLYSEIKVEDLKNYLKNLSFYWVDKVNFWGMIGFGGVFLDKNLFESFMGEIFLARVVGLYYHEGIHAAIRDFFDDFCWTTPRNENPDIHLSNQDLEGGYLIEELIFGSYNIKYWQVANSILDIARWNKSEPMFTKIEMNSMMKRGIENPRNSGLCERNEKFAF